ncbi:Cystathionine gamma-synthase [Aspergillus sp. HF37]|nr:Cystathionine gamma-synthase [Aspergillus sp. HF37]
MHQEVGDPVPPNTDHAVSVSLPTWNANVAYEEGEPWIAKKMKCGYPRFFVHPIAQSLAREIVRRHGNPENETATLFPSAKTASVCYAFIVSKVPADDARKVRVVNLVPSSRTESESSAITSALSCVIYPNEYASLSKQVWQHTGNGISSRRAEFCLVPWRMALLYMKGLLQRRMRHRKGLSKGHGGTGERIR